MQWSFKIKKVNALTTRHLQAFALLSVSILPALNFLHLMQPDPIVHRDICCANVLLEPLQGDQWRVKSHRLWLCEFTEPAEILEIQFTQLQNQVTSLSILIIIWTTEFPEVSK